jgi:hypothetical protein
VYRVKLRDTSAGHRSVLTCVERRDGELRWSVWGIVGRLSDYVGVLSASRGVTDRLRRRESLG